LRTIDNHGRPCFIIGDPVAHTISPKIYNQAFDSSGLPHSYFALEVSDNELEEFIEIFEKIDALGANITLPHKKTICSLISERTPEVDRLGAANTIYRHEGKLKLSNTNVYGFSRLIEPWLAPARKEGVLMIGAGGTARACLLALEQNQVKNIHLWNQEEEQSMALADEFAGMSFEMIEPDEFEDHNFAVVINATIVGFKENDPSPYPKKAIRSSMVGIDLIYNRKTNFVKAFEKHGQACRKGVEMLTYQAAFAWELWTGRQAPLETMLNTVNSVIGSY